MSSDSESEYEEISLFPELPPSLAPTPEWTSGQLSSGPTLVSKATGAPLTALPDLEAIANWAHCGKGEKSVMDHALRKTLRIDPSNVTVAWESDGLQQMVSHIQQTMCPHWELGAELHDVLVYRKGDHFRPHKDARKLPFHVATVVVGVSGITSGKRAKKKDDDGLSCRGGDLVFPESTTSGGADRWTCTGGGSWCAWFIETLHEVEDVKAGHRVVAVYNLVVKSQLDNAILTNTLSEVTEVSCADKTRRSLFGEVPLDVIVSFLVPYLTLSTTRSLSITSRHFHSLVGGTQNLFATLIYERHVQIWFEICKKHKFTSFSFVAAHMYSLNGKNELVDDEALCVLRGRDRFKAGAMISALRRTRLGQTTITPHISIVPYLGIYEKPDSDDGLYHDPEIDEMLGINGDESEPETFAALATYCKFDDQVVSAYESSSSSEPDEELMQLLNEPDVGDKRLREWVEKTNERRRQKAAVPANAKRWKRVPFNNEIDDNPVKMTSEPFKDSLTFDVDYLNKLGSKLLDVVDELQGNGPFFSAYIYKKVMVVVSFEQNKDNDL